MWVYVARADLTEPPPLPSRWRVYNIRAGRGWWWKTWLIGTPKLPPVLAYFARETCSAGRLHAHASILIPRMRCIVLLLKDLQYLFRKYFRGIAIMVLLSDRFIDGQESSLVSPVTRPRYGRWSYLYLYRVYQVYLTYAIAFFLGNIGNID